jgi:NTE family protein
MFHLFKRKIGLALGAGSAKGLAHIGVIKELEKNNIAIDYIAGTSIGAIVGGFYAYTKNIKVLEELAYSQGYREMFDAFFDPFLKSGVFKGEKVLNMLGGYIPDDVLIQDTKIPFAAVATNINTGERVVMKEGSLKEAIRASMSIPLLFKPVEHERKILIDGGTTDPVPVGVVRDMGAQRVIAVNLYSQMFPKHLNINKLNFMQIIEAMIDISLYNLSKESIEKADIGLNLPIDPDLPITAFAEDPSKLIEIGEKATREVMDELKRL